MILFINTDGGSKGNPGPAAIGVAFSDGSDIIQTYRKDIGIASNNVAEYTALLVALQLVRDENRKDDSPFKSATQIICRADSELMVKQLNGAYKVKHPDMRILYDQVLAAARVLEIPVTYTHVPREQNAVADALVNDQY